MYRRLKKYETLVVWYNHNKKEFYIKKYTTKNFDQPPFIVGYKNQYDHEVMFIIDVDEILEMEIYGWYRTKKARFKRRLIRFLDKKL